MSTQIETVPGKSLPEQLREPKRKISRIRYRFRQVSSKGALLVLFWIFLISCAFGSLNGEHASFVSLIVNSGNGYSDPYQYLNYVLPTVIWLVLAMISGLLADALFGNYKMAKFGIVLLFIATILDCVVVLVSSNLTTTPYTIVQTIPKCLRYAGSAIVLVTSLQLGLDQMPSASAANITSFIAWFVFTTNAGMWIRTASLDILQCSMNDNEKSTYTTVWNLFPVLCLCIVLCSDFFLSPQWLIIEPTTPQSFKVIYEVLMFAKKHKAPVQRSALTYWEEDIPSRIDLGKSRYGGPFTTEQVENVKTTLKLLAVSVPIPVILLSFYLFSYELEYYSIFSDNTSPGFVNMTQCSYTTLQYFVTNELWWVVVSIVIYEFIFYPFLMARIPSILKRIGIASLLIVLVNIIYLILSGFSYKLENIIDLNIFWIKLPQSIVTAQITILLFTAVLEFICAQSPQNMKGLVIGYTWCMYSFSSIFAAVVFAVFVIGCSESYCVVIYCSLVTSMSIVGFIVYCILARWYKRRVRDETHTPHRWVEDVYNRYLLHKSKSYT